MKIRVYEGDALIPVDVQNDFCPGGSLAVPDGDQVVPVFNALMEQLLFGGVYATQDWHPEGHGSFASTHGVEPFTMGKLSGADQMMWPEHCVQGTLGAEFHPMLNTVPFTHVTKKGKNKKFDSYSGVKDAGGEETDLVATLRANNITRVFVGGLATDYCVKATALDLKAAGFDVWVITDACRGITQNDDAFNEMVGAGCNLCTSDELLAAA